MNKYKDMERDVNSKEQEKLSSVRYKSTIKMVNKYGGIIHPAIDCGEKNALSRKLGIKKNTAWDLNWYWHTSNKFKTITAFEVIEHLQNPLLFVMEVYNRLENYGCFYLTTPVRWWLGKGKHHFAEYNKEDLLFLFRIAGFRKIEIKRIKAYNLNWHFGIRPVIRYLRDRVFGQCWFVVGIK